MKATSSLLISITGTTQMPFCRPNRTREQDAGLCCHGAVVKKDSSRRLPGMPSLLPPPRPIFEKEPGGHRNRDSSARRMSKEAAREQRQLKEGK